MSVPKIIVPLDYLSIEPVREKLAELDPKLCVIKIGKTLFTHYGPELISEVMNAGYKVFLDLKFHDIPEQVFGAVHAAAEMGVWMLTVHVVGGKKMLEAARKAIDQFPENNRPLLIGVTILTSLDNSDLELIGLTEKIDIVVPKLAQFAKDCGLDGVVSSPHEAELIRKKVGSDFLIVTPGIRLEGDEAHDQKRIMTPEKAIKSGSDYLVIGRSITNSKNPKETLKNIQKSLNPLSRER